MMIDPREPHISAFELDDQTLHAYLLGNATETVDRWIEQGAGRRQLLDGLRQGMTDSLGDLQRRRRIMAEEIIRTASSHTKLSRTNKGTPPRWHRTAIVIAALTVVVATLGKFTLNTAPSANGRGYSSVYTRTYTTRLGERAIVMAHSTRVTLAPMTTIHLHGTTVDLLGEAYFEVVGSRHTPLVVRTGTIDVRVLGTAFNVRRYTADRVVQVAVTSGRVAVGHRAWLTVPAGQVARVTDSTATFISDDPLTYTAWTSGHLVFHDVPLSEVLETMRRWSGVRFTVSDSALAHRRITATVDAGSGPELLRALSLVLNVDATFINDSHNTVILRRRNVTPIQPSRRDSVTDATLTTFKEIGR